MRRASMALIGALVALSLAAPAAQAAKPHHEQYQTRWVNAFWHSKVKVDADTYLRMTWYVGAYDNGDEGFFSDAYRYVERCTKREGHDRCRTKRGMSWYGYTSRTGPNTFTLDKLLTSGHLDATYKLYRYVDRDRVLVGRFHIVTDLVGTGQLTRGRNSYTSHQGCTTFKYSGKYAYRQATATGTIDRADGGHRDLASTDDANFGENQNIEIDHTC